MCNTKTTPRYQKSSHKKLGNKFIDTRAMHIRVIPTAFLGESFSPEKMAEMSTLIISTEELSSV